ncbi:AbrB/MazE/SpoVT family DNA-binding domain-containing protein [Fictibacillus aquaticus]|uniref:AbrB/MazE/SpoVT family DNA-binding domain-containing protein n=1 Tax=Fictibacillus aquaticus TaxID=2021314 RepID=UPI00105547C4|nr:AbrB/MazE/SpoVT family DNA-binding domain-containing protein [Fictibacillus aquaticus]
MKKALGIVRKIDELGRVVIPKEVRRTQGWDTGTPMEMFMSADGLVMREYGNPHEELVGLLESVGRFLKDGPAPKLEEQVSLMIEKYSK